MGGKAQQQTRRLTTQEWEKVINELDEKFAVTGAFLNIVAPRPEPEKLDHGDIDLLAVVNPNMDSAHLHQIIEQIGLNNRRGTSYLYTSDAVGDCQVDLNLVAEPSDLPLHRFLADYGDTSMIIGCYAKALGFRLSKSSGFSVHKPIDTNDTFTYHITKDPAMICGYLQLDFNAWEKGFKTKDALFRWLRPAFPYVQNLHSDRPMMSLFLKQEWAGDLLRNRSRKSSSYSFERMAVFGHLESFNAALAEYLIQKEQDRKYKAVVNGWNIQQRVFDQHGRRLEGKELGLLVKRVKADLAVRYPNALPTRDQLYTSIDSHYG